MDICLLKVKAYTTTHVYYMVTRKVRVHEVQILTFFDVSSYQDILPKNKKKREHYQDSMKDYQVKMITLNENLLNEGRTEIYLLRYHLNLKIYTKYSSTRAQAKKS